MLKKVMKKWVCGFWCFDKAIRYMKMTITIDLLKELIIKYDYEQGSYPDSCYEGLRVYEFICEQLKIPSSFENCDIDSEYTNLFKVFKNE